MIWDFNQTTIEKIKTINLKNCTNFFKEPFDLCLLEQIYYSYNGIYCMKSLKLKYDLSQTGFIKMEAKCLVKDFILLLYLLDGKNRGAWDSEDFKTQLELKINKKTIELTNKCCIDLILEVDYYEPSELIYCTATQKITKEYQYGVVHSTVLDLSEDNTNLSEIELRREILVFGGKISDVEW